jgi:hypothetical protein
MGEQIIQQQTCKRTRIRIRIRIRIRNTAMTTTRVRYLLINYSNIIITCYCDKCKRVSFPNHLPVPRNRGNKINKEKEGRSRDGFRILQAIK